VLTPTGPIDDALATTEGKQNAMPKSSDAQKFQSSYLTSNRRRSLSDVRACSRWQDSIGLFGPTESGSPVIVRTLGIDQGR
jgi:hypothetical protein